MRALRTVIHWVAVFVVTAALLRSDCTAEEKTVFTVTGLDDSQHDSSNVQQTIDQACMVSDGLVRLIGTFDFGDADNCVTIPGPITIMGQNDPSVVAPGQEHTTVIKSTGTAPLVIADTGPEDGEIVVRNLWFDGAQTLAVSFRQIVGTVRMIDNRVSGVQPGREFRFAMAGAKIGGDNEDTASSADQSRGSNLTGSIYLEGNYIDNDVPFAVGDDNGFAFAGVHLKRIEVTNNYIHAGEAVEIEGCRGTDAVYIIKGNTIVQTPVVSNLAQLTNAPNLKRHGGHPAAIKPIDAQAKLIVIQDNSIDCRNAYPTAIGIMTGNSNANSKTIIENNHCQMNHQFAGILGGWAGTPGFFDPFYMQNAEIRNNTFSGHALFGLAWLDFNFVNSKGVPVADMAVVNKASNNVVEGTDLSDFSWARAAAYLGPSTHNNTLTGPFRGRVRNPVKNDGTDNTIYGDRQPTVTK